MFPLSRLCYAPFKEDRDLVRSRGLSAWLDQQLDPKKVDLALDRLRETKLQIKYPAGSGEQVKGGESKNWPAVDEMRSLRFIEAPIDEAWKLLNPATPISNEEINRPWNEVSAATIVRAVHGRSQLYEQLAGFWHDHFSVAAEDRRIGAALPAYDRDAIRAHALGNFRDMLEAVASSPAMLVYLSNFASRAGAANENYARELLELHTLGRDAYLNDKYDRWRNVPGAEEGKPSGYIDEDVYEAARAFTGWSIENGQRIDSSTELPRTGKFVYVDAWHDGYQKRVLATEIASFGAAMADGRKVLDLVASHPATAAFLSEKLCRRFVSDTPSKALVESTAKVWTEHLKAPDQIAKVVKHIALSPEFAQSKGKKPRSPLALVAQFARDTGIDLEPTAGLNNQLTQCGQRLFGWPAPNGRPDTAEYYLTATFMRQRWTMLTKLAQNAWQNGVPRGLGEPGEIGRVAAHWVAEFGGSKAQAQAMIAAMDRSPVDAVTDPKAHAQLVSLCAAVPQYHLT
jgi:uncharacterized protein (DUF1800 family)